VKAAEYSLGPFFVGIHGLENYFGLGDYFALGLKAFSRCS